jgi:hypothetical protein
MFVASGFGAMSWELRAELARAEIELKETEIERIVERLW